MQLQIGDDVTHNGYPLGTLAAIRTDLSHGGKIGLVQIHDHADEAPSPIALHELKRDVRHTEAAL